MICARIRPILMDFALGTPVSSEASAHLVGCRECQDEAARLKARISLLDGELRAVTAARPGPDFLQRVRGSLDRERVARAPVPWVLAPVLMTLAIGIGLFFARRSAPVPAPPRIPGASRAESARAPGAMIPAPVQSAPRRTGRYPSRRTARPAVLVDPAETAALADLTRLASGGVRPEPLPKPFPDLPDTKEIAIAPIDVPPLDAGPPSQAETERSSS